MIETIRRVLVDPDEFFEEEVDRPRLREPALVVLALGVLGALSSFQFLIRATGATAGSPRAATAVAIGASSQLAIPFVIWFVYAGGFQLISLMFQGEGSFFTTFALAGWGFLPQIAGDALSLVAMTIVLRGTTPTATSGPEGFRTFSQQLQADPLLAATGVVGIGLTLWSGYLWVFAVKHARALTRNQAIFTVAIPVFMSVSWTLDRLTGIDLA